MQCSIVCVCMWQFLHRAWPKVYISLHPTSFSLTVCHNFCCAGYIDAVTSHSSECTVTTILMLGCFNHFVMCSREKWNLLSATAPDDSSFADLVTSNSLMVHILVQYILVLVLVQRPKVTIIQTASLRQSTSPYAWLCYQVCCTDCCCLEGRTES